MLLLNPERDMTGLVLFVMRVELRVDAEAGMVVFPAIPFRYLYVCSLWAMRFLNALSSAEGGAALGTTNWSNAKNAPIPGVAKQSNAYGPSWLRKTGSTHCVNAE